MLFQAGGLWWAEDTLVLTRGESRRQRDDRKVLAATDRKARCR